MIYTVPQYYSKFKCTAAACSDTCCAGWGIMIDERALSRYRRLKGAFGNRLRNSIDWKEGSFYQYSRRCAFLNEENLCDIYGEAGEDMLCDTCKNYPRHMEEFAGRREITLSLSCPEAAKLILGGEEPVRFLTRETIKEERVLASHDPLLSTLVEARSILFYVTQDREVDFKVRLTAVLGLCHDIQLRLGKGRLHEIDKLLLRFQGMEYADYCKGRVNRRLSGTDENPYAVRDMLESLFLFEVSIGGWTEYLGRKLRFLGVSCSPDGRRIKDEGGRVSPLSYGGGTEDRNYRKNKRRFAEEFLEKEGNLRQWHLWGEKLVVYAISTYFCGAVYDRDVISKGKLSVVFVLLVMELCIATWMEHGGRLDFKDVLEVSQKFSRELEHSEVNLTIMEGLLRKEKCCGFLSLLRMIDMAL